METHYKISKKERKNKLFLKIDFLMNTLFTISL